MFLSKTAFAGMTLALGLITLGPATAQNGPVPEHIPGVLLVGYKQGVSVASRDSVHDALGARRVHSYKHIRADVVRVDKDRDLGHVITAYQAQPGIAYAERNYVVRAQVMPNDPSMGQLWGMHNLGQMGGLIDADIDAPEAWDLATGSNSVIVAVIDTGVDYTHPDLAANMWTNMVEAAGTLGMDDDGNGIIDDIYGARWNNFDGTPTNGNPMDGDGHGTHCSGTIGGIGNNGVGVAGVNWTVQIMALKFLTDLGYGSSADAISALDYAIDKGAHLTSNSWGGGPYNQALKDMIDAAGAANQLFIAAAGNDSSDNDIVPFYPSNYDSPNIISVAASETSDGVAWFSNWGFVSVDIAAPGENIFSSLPGGAYGYGSGTSMATPHVSGVAALLLSQHPGTSHQTLKQWILDSGDLKLQWLGRTATGRRLNAHEALILAGGGRPTPTPIPTPEPPSILQLYDITYKDRHNKTIQFKIVDNEILIDNPNAFGSFKIRKKSWAVNFTPIPALRTAGGLERLDTQADILEVETSGALNNLVAQRAYVESVRANPCRTIRMLGQSDSVFGNATQFFTSIYSGPVTGAEPLVVPGAPALSVNLTGVGMRELIAEGQVATVKLNSKKFKTAAGDTTLSIAEVPADSITRILCGELKTLSSVGGGISPGSVRGGSGLASTLSARGIAVGLRYRNVPVKSYFPASVQPGSVRSDAQRLTVTVTGGDLIADEILAAYEITKLSAALGRARSGGSSGFYGGAIRANQIQSGTALTASEPAAGGAFSGPPAPDIKLINADTGLNTYYDAATTSVIKNAGAQIRAADGCIASIGTIQTKRAAANAVPEWMIREGGAWIAGKAYSALQPKTLNCLTDDTFMWQPCQ